MPLNKLSGDIASGKRRCAYHCVLEGPEAGREERGWYIGLAVENEPGYHQLKPGFGPYPTYDAALTEARYLNERLGMDELESTKIILSTMGRDGLRRRKKS